MTRPAALFAALTVAALAFAGCGGTATFVSTEPPPDTSADAWYASRMAKVRTALTRAMTEAGFSLEPASSKTVVTGTKQQLPYVDEETGGPAGGPLPAYKMHAVLTRKEKTHVRLAVHPECAACDGATPYEWEYPVDLLRDVLERTRRILGETRPRFAYPRRY
ncbi:MAG: hypothetical protein GF400_11580, partial [Candidatus Eisenbacteria bacterium]|nr:hypothetical protein [Candidatus Eisenbacteria bacterium]